MTGELVDRLLAHAEEIQQSSDVPVVENPPESVTTALATVASTSGEEKPVEIVKSTKCDV